MGRNLEGKEIGHGIIQKKNGRYEARYVDRFGKRKSISGTNLRDVKGVSMKHFMKTHKKLISRKI